MFIYIFCPELDGFVGHLHQIPSLDSPSGVALLLRNPLDTLCLYITRKLDFKQAAPP